MIEETFEQIAAYVALGCDGLAVLCIAIGAARAAIAVIPAALRNARGGFAQIWRSFAVWLALALEVTLAADIAETSLAPSWDAIGQLAAIAAIRTALNFFLERDLDTVDNMAREQRVEPAPQASGERAG